MNRKFRMFILACSIAWIAAVSMSRTQPQPITVVDGDTVRQSGVTYRLVGFDSPETGLRARCDHEAELGARATLRMRALAARGELTPVACTCRPGTEGTAACNYFRSCAVLRSDGVDVAKIMIEEGLARSYLCSNGRCPPRQSWCTQQ